MTIDRVRLAGRLLRFVDLPSLIGPDLVKLPRVLRVLLENVLRHQGDEEAAVRIFTDWLPEGRSEAEIPFRPGRILMHDTTCVPALVDIAAMRDVLHERGADPRLLSPTVPVDVSVDHSVAVDRFGAPDALRSNMRKELERNAERYRLMKWATKSLPGVRVHPPGTGIMHTINLEQLATVVGTEWREGEEWAVPDTLLGTDSHTPMVNGIGVLAWGVGGLEAESAMFGMPVILRLPEVIGVRLSGRLPAGTLSTDLALAVTSRLRKWGVSGQFVEFFGPGVSTLGAGDRSVVANMAPEYGASSGYFPIDGNTLRYLAATGRPRDHVEHVETFARAMGLWFDPDAEPRFTETVDIDLSELRAAVAGPRRPQDLLSTGQVASALERSAGRRLIRAKGAPVPQGAVAIAAITSCTNTSDPYLLAAAGLVARKARRLGLRPPAWVKTSLAPGSPAARRYLARSGLLDDLEAIGFGIVGFGCTTCIGNSGPLVSEMEEAIRAGVTAAAVLSGNRNFPGRVHPLLQNGFLASPPMVVAYALAGDVMRDIATDALATGAAGESIRLADLWPDADEVAAAVGAHADDYADAFAQAGMNAEWERLAAPDGPLFPWDATSTYLRRPPFASGARSSRLGGIDAVPLLVLGDDITTDHISPAGQISPSSAAGLHLVERGDPAGDLNVFASRRGNWEAMVRGLFDNQDAVNLLAPGLSPGHTVHDPTGETAPLWDVACRYRDEGESVVVVAGERYGAGSSRDWAAKGVALLGVRAVLAQSFERIHRSNLVGMGILPVELPAEGAPLALDLRPGDRVHVDAASVRPRGPVPVRIQRSNGSSRTLTGKAAVETDFEVDLLRAGGMIPSLLSRVGALP